MDRKAAKELLHIKGWLGRVDGIVERGKDVYLADDLLQEAGDSLMMKLGEAANWLSRLGVLARTEWKGPGRREPQLHHPSVRRDQPRSDLADAVGGPARVERVAPETLRGRCDLDRRRIRLRSFSPGVET